MLLFQKFTLVIIHLILGAQLTTKRSMHLTIPYTASWLDPDMRLEINQTNGFYVPYLELIEQKSFRGSETK